VSDQLNPVAYESAATSAGSAAEKTAHDINQEKNSWMAPVLGALGSLGGAALRKMPGGGGGGGGYSGGYGGGGYYGSGVGGYETGGMYGG
jgi:hypothetical protein